MVLPESDECTRFHSKHHIRSMRIAMHEPVVKNHLCERFADLQVIHRRFSKQEMSISKHLRWGSKTNQVSHHFGFDAETFHGFHICDTDAFHELHAHQTRGANLPVNSRHSYVRSQVRWHPRKILYTSLRVFPLLHKIQLLQTNSYSQLQSHAMLLPTNVVIRARFNGTHIWQTLFHFSHQPPVVKAATIF